MREPTDVRTPDFGLARIDSPVFGLAGFVMPADKVRGSGTWFFLRKRELQDFNIRRSGEPPAVWEKKGSSLYTVRTVERHPELRKTINRLDYFCLDDHESPQRFLLALNHDFRLRQSCAGGAAVGRFMVGSLWRFKAARACRRRR